MSQINTENDKKPKTFQFLMFLYIFSVKVSTNLVDWNVLRGQRGKNWLFSCLFEQFIVFIEMKMPLIDTKNDKNPKIFQFSKLLCNFSLNFWLNLWIRTLKKVNKERICSPVGFSE